MFQQEAECEPAQLSEPEILGGGGQLSVNQGGSAHHPHNEIGTAEHRRRYRSLHNAAIRGIFFNGLFLWVQVVDHGVEIKYPSTHSVIVHVEDSTERFPALQPRNLVNRVLQWIKRLLWKAIVQLGKQPCIIHHIYSKWENSADLVWALLDYSVSYQISQFH
ncbi:hypothetical protein Dsin_014159 [Dipteronia sinensis]|uniref:Uncharacterized protein n=1 Tax=Dipteronia sinensis TaxID=43782 RepID=A0AAE0AMK0_9ROSI|nr:hypothetical protein Dsin_014159 [Dipteronia sinensis]